MTNETVPHGRNDSDDPLSIRSEAISLRCYMSDSLTSVPSSLADCFLFLLNTLNCMHTFYCFKKLLSCISFLFTGDMILFYKVIARKSRESISAAV